MAASLVGGAFLSAFLDVVFDRLSSPQVADLIRGKKLDRKLLRKLKNTLYAVGAVLNDAEQKQINDTNVKMWLDDLRDAVYEADDLLDQVSTKAATQKEVSNLLSGYPNLQDREMVDKLEDIVDSLESLLESKDSFGLKEIPRENLSWRTPSTSLVEGSKIHGRDQDKEAIIKLLLDDNSDDKISVIPIVGIGGVGKTTVAQLLYNDDNLKNIFDFKAWVCVSEEFDILNATKTMTGAVASTTNDLNLLQLDLKEKLAGKKFFIVLDDVWNENYVDWNILLKPFQYGMKGSKILVTTRSEKVALVVQTIPAYRLNQLSDEDCWLVFANHACLSLGSSGNSILEKIGREITKKCKGLPLAAETLGGLLRRNLDMRYWNTILKSDIWDLPESESKIIPALKISYYYLPPHLKHCFVYCSLYPKDYEYNKDELILLWMAEDLLHPPKKGKTLEEVGYDYFDDLVSRSFFQHSSTRRSFVMHDLMHDLAKFVAGEFYFRSEELGKVDNMSIRTRHLSFSMFSHPISKTFEAFSRVKSIRTFLPVKFKTVPFSLESVASIILSKFKYLRVLSFRSFQDPDALPDSIGELIHLRYLDVSWTSIKTLPESLCNLYNLQTLKLSGCYNLTMLPSGMQNLVNLRYLDIAETVLEEMPRGMNRLRHLQVLSEFVVGKHEENGIKELGGLADLHGSLVISKLENISNSGEALEARMTDKEHIKCLYLKWSWNGDFTDSMVERDILDKLRPHKDLKDLRIFCYRGTRFPDWVGQSSYLNMTCLYLYDCGNCFVLPSLGQLPSLKYLLFQNFNALETIGAEFYKNDGDHSSLATPFPSLVFLEFREMSCWQAWCLIDSNAFPQLKKLTISDCPRLMGDLPNHLPALQTLYIERCEQLASSLPRAPALRKLDISESINVQLQELPLSLHYVSIGGFQLIESMFRAIPNTQLTCLHSLTISGCSSAISYPGGLSLTLLEIRNCRKVEFPKERRHELLESLFIINSCDSLTSFPLENFPNLKVLHFVKCENLESLSGSQGYDLQHLMNFKIICCPNFVSFPTEGLAAPHLITFFVYGCYKLKSLPSRMNTLFPKLVYLEIKDSPEIDSFPEGGVPPNLRKLLISNCEKLLNSLASMDLDAERLRISGPCENVKSFPKEGLLLKLSSLAHLELDGFLSLETLDCKGLLHLTSLQHLSIMNCPRLVNLVGERLPASLMKLEISRSPLLEEQCQMKHPQIWPKISHILGIRVNDKWIS